MKYLISIALLLIYLWGSFHSSWILIDFYWNRDAYILQYCQNLDEGITQCRASCYLEEQMKQEQEQNKFALVSPKSLKIFELVNDQEFALNILADEIKREFWVIIAPYHFDYHSRVFHPPNA